MHGIAVGVRVERGAAVVAELERKLLVMNDDVLDPRFAQQPFDFSRRVAVFVLAAEQGPDHTVVDSLAVAWAETDAVFLKTFVVEAAEDGA